MYRFIKYGPTFTIFQELNRSLGPTTSMVSCPSNSSSVNDEGPFPWNSNHTMISVQCFKTGASFPLSIRKQHFDMCYEITITPQQVPAICNLWSPVIKKLRFKVLLSVSMSNGLLEYMCPLFMVERVTWKNVLPQCDLGKMSSLQQHRDLS